MGITGLRGIKMKVRLYDIPENSKIICNVSDGSTWVSFRHLDGMYSYCVSEKGNIYHLYAMSELTEVSPSVYTIMQPQEDAEEQNV